MLKEQPVRPVELIKSIEYQTGAVVSKTLVKTKTGSITLFAFDREQELSEHTTPHHAFLNVLEGEAKITIAGNSHRLQAGQAMELPAGVPHAVEAVDKFKMLLIMLKSSE